MSGQRQFVRPGSEAFSAFFLLQMHPRKSKICLWRDLTMQDIAILERAESGEHLHRRLSQILSLEYGGSDPRISVLLDLYYYTIRFCLDSGFSKEQTSCLFSILKETHAACVGSPLSTVDLCYSYFNELLLDHSVHRPPFSASVFSQQQLEKISHYVLETYFRHFKLYKYVFTPQ
ncbi:cilia- and flagella-associated protein 119, partial [Rhinophrynus dorsalis]